MENAPVINMIFMNNAPGVEDDVVQRFHKWSIEVYLPIILKIQGVTGLDRYTIVRKSPDYPAAGTIMHWESIGVYENSLKNPERMAVRDDLNTWTQRRVREGVWSAAYELAQGFRTGTANVGAKKDTKIENASLMHLEAYRMPQEEHEKYNKWFNEFGRVFVPLFMKTCGLKGYDYLKYSGFSQLAQGRETEYPPYISILYFEDLKSFEHFQESPEQDSLQSALRNIFPLGLNYRWYVQYQLTNRWRK